MTLTCLAIYLLGNKARAGFFLMMLGNLGWISLGVIVSSTAMILANLVFFGMNLRGLLKWSREAFEASTDDRENGHTNRKQ